MLSDSDNARGKDVKTNVMEALDCQKFLNQAIQSQQGCQQMEQVPRLQ